MDGANLQALSEIILPPGSTSADLQAAIDGAAVGDVIIISGDMPFTNTGMVIIAESKEITIQSDEGNHWVMAASGSYLRHFTINGNLILQNITLDGNDIGGGALIINGSLTMDKGTVIQNCRSNVSGGGIRVNNGALIMNQGTMIQNCHCTGNGGGAYANPNGIITINGGIIKENTASGAGGGIMFQESTFIMDTGEFLNNTASASGGAIQTLGNNTVTISNSIISGNKAGFLGGGIGIPINTIASISDTTISKNTAARNGGGLYIQGEATLANITINENTANTFGGGIYIFASGKADITGESYVINNNATNGGGIYTVPVTYNNLATGSETVFQCNWSSRAYQPPMDAGTLYPDIQFVSTSITDHPLNNFDINYNVGEPIDVYSNITYEANGGIGSYTGPDIITGSMDTVLHLDKTGINRSGYTFTIWNTQPDGSGTSYAPGEMLTLGCSMILFAQWAAEPEIYTITYNCNGGNGGYIDHCREFDLYYTVLSTAQTGISRTGSTFIEWNTLANGSGVAYASGETITVAGDLILYAQWRQIPQQTGLCRASATKCRKSIEGQKLWVDNNNSGNTRPSSVEIILLRDGEVYKRTNIDSTGDGHFSFCCLPIWKNSAHKYNYQIDETTVPGYTKTIEGYNIINTFIP